MKYKALKRYNKNYEKIYTKQKETKELHIKLGDIVIYIEEHQLDEPLNEPQIEILGEDGSYSMNLSTFIEKITA